MARKPAGPEIPEAVREAAERTVAEARKAMDRMMDATRDVVARTETASRTMGDETAAARDRALGAAEASIAAALELADRLAKSRTLEEIAGHQAAFARSQMELAARHAREMGEAGLRFAQEAMKPPR